MVSTRERLRSAIATYSAGVPAAPAAPALNPGSLPLPELLRGEWRENEHGPVFVRDEWFPLDHEHGTARLGDALDAEPDALALLVGVTPPPASRLAFFDIETTGLGGTGTYLVLAGVGSFERVADGEPLAFRMRQYFLADLASESAMLAMLRDDLARFDGIVTYNGRAFDVPFVEMRMTLARLRSPCAGMPHVDLLHPVRRLYRHRMPACRLPDVERRLLRIERVDDIPGAIIPSLYFDYLRAGRVAPLRAVFRHNAEDVLSLVGVLSALARLLDGRPLEPEDAVAVGRWWEPSDEPRAALLYREALPWLRGAEDWRWAAARHARLCRRLGLREEAAALWQELWEQGDGAAGLDLAKHFEHRVRDFGAAESVVTMLVARSVEPGREGLVHRLQRIRRKRALRRG